MLRELRAVHVGEGEIRVLAVDGSGNVRIGPRGAMTASDLAHELKQQEAFREIGWTPRAHPYTTGTRTGRRTRWQ
jgi:hypothetical protein